MTDPKSSSKMTHQAIAIIGIGCRFPGDINDVDSFWELLARGTDAITAVPPDRLDLHAACSPDPGAQGKVATQHGGFLKHVETFDAAFFGISHREAEYLDPQQRLLLEVSWEALEHAGLNVDALAGSRTGVFTGLWSGDYEHLLYNSTSDTDLYMTTGGGRYSAAGRISYLLDLQGPSMTVDTACSSSLVSVHLACQSLILGESELALAGGVNLIMHPAISVAYANAGMLSPDGRCKFGDASANGYVRSEGCGMLVLKRLSSALADKDNIHAVIVGSAVNHDGHEGSFVAPNQKAQEKLVRRAYRRAALSPAQVDYVEAHGTGTSVGDPVEIKALSAVFGEGRDGNGKCLLGSVKTNIGHTEAASGVAGLIKAVMTLKNRLVPPNLHFNEPNPAIEWDRIPFQIPKTMQALTAKSGSALVGVNSFGVSGTNAHVILQEAPSLSAPDLPEKAGDFQSAERTLLLPLSARSPEALKAMCRPWRRYLEDAKAKGVSLYDICYTAGVRRTHHHHRLAIVGTRTEELIARLEAVEHDGSDVGLVPGPEPDCSPEGTVFVFSGQGPQWHGMGRQLLASETVYRKVIERCDELLKAHVDWSLLDELQASEGDSRLDQTEIAQPAIFAMQIGLAELWRSWGIEPEGIVGHSLGEVAAACVAGILDLEDAVRVVYHRGRLLQHATGLGKMAAVEITPEEAQAVVARYPGRLSIGAINSPRSVTLSGEAEALEEVLAGFSKRDIFCRLLPVNYAFHSQQTEPYREEMRTAVAGLRTKPARIPIISTVTGRPAVDGDFGAAYWGENIRQPVQFASAVKGLAQRGCRTFLELGPHPVLGLSITQCLEQEGRQGRALPSLRRGRADREVLLGSLGALYESGQAVKWDGVYPLARLGVNLPKYPWQKIRLWFQGLHADGRRSSPSIFPREKGGNAWLYRYIRSATHPDLHLWETEVDSERFQWADDHRVAAKTVFPGAAFVEMMREAAFQAFGWETGDLREIAFTEALLLEEGHTRLVQVVVSPGTGQPFDVRILSRSTEGDPQADAWREHANGRLYPPEPEAYPSIGHDVETLRRLCDTDISGDAHYGAMHEIRIDYGPSFRMIDWIGIRGNQALGKIEMPRHLEPSSDEHAVHTVLLDGCFQVLVALAQSTAAAQGETGTWMPAGVTKIRFGRRPPKAGSLWALATALGDGDLPADRYHGDVFLLNEDGNVIGEIKGLRLNRIAAAPVEDVDDLLYQMQWHPRPLEVESSVGPGWMPGPDAVEERVSAAPLPEILRKDAETAEALLPRIEALSIDYIAAALERLGLRFEVDQSFTGDELAQRLRIGSRHRRLLERLLSFLQEEGLLEPSDGGWHIVRSIEPRPCREIEARLLSQFPQCRPELSLLYRCGGQLAEVLTGAADPLELLFPGGSLEEAERFYRDSVFARTAIHQAGQSLRAVIERLPIGRQLKILEVGAGTGGLTSHLLPLLPAERTRYVFTDIGAAFVEQARKKYAAFGCMAYEVLDIEKDPMAQGFEPNSFDIVVAANCLHATRDMGATLSNVHKLLSPGGLMLLVEGMHDPRWIDLIFGLTEGWWMFEDIQRRPHQPLLSAAAWKSVAAESGFTDVAVFGQAKAALFDQSIVAARVPLAADGAHPAPDKGAWLIFADRGGVGEALGHDLRERGDDCRLVYKQADDRSGGTGEGSIDAANPAHFAQVLREFEDLEATGRRAVVYLWPLDDEIAGPQTVRRLRDAQEDLCGGLLLLAQTLAGSPSGRRNPLWVISRRSLPTGTEGWTLGLAAAALSGLVKVIDLEHPELNCRQVDVDLGDDDAARTAEVLLAEFAADEGETQIVYREDNRWVPRVIRHGAAQRAGRDWLALPEDRPARLGSENRGTLDGLKIRPVRYTPPGPGEVAIQVRATGLNFRDVVCALGLIADNDDPGLECAGQIVEVGEGVADFVVGDAVIALSPGAFATFVVAKAALVVPKPATMTFEQAATIPIAFLTAYHGLVQLADLRPNEKVLIHAASGGVGLAAVQLAKACGAQIFGTAGSRTKRAYLESIGVDHVLYSRSLAFADRILDITAGEGVDVVLNSLSGDFIPRSFSVLRKKGRFIEIGKRDVWTREQVSEIRPDAFYATFDLASMMAEQPEMLQPTMATLMEKFNAGELTPLPASIVPMEQVARAYHTMQQARHIGKIVVNQQPWSGGRPIDAPDAFSPRATYLITGGCGGIGLKLVQWLFERGARHFALIGRSKPSTDVAARISDLEGAGANIRLAQCDVASQTQTEQLFEKSLPSMPPLRGVFHLAGALDDGALIHQSWPRFEKVLAPKVLGGWNLHCLTRQLALDCFVMFSSWSSFLGSQGQANHSAANAFLDALAWQRRAEGLPALSINWGAWAEIGAATKGDAAEHLRRRGIGSFSPEMGLRALGRLMSQGMVQVAVTPFDLAMWRKSSPAAHRSRWFALLDTDAQAAQEELDGQVPTAAEQPLGEMLDAAASESERRQVLDTFLKAQVAQTLRLPLARIDANKPFKSYGMDSLTALEFRNRIELATGLSLSATLVFNYPTIRQLQDFLLEKLADQTHGPADDADGTEADKPTATPTEEEMRALLDEVEALSEEDARGLIDDEQ